ncbi:MAG: DNA translocase FtsK [Patescibacteria group bacterium]
MRKRKIKRSEKELELKKEKESHVSVEIKKSVLAVLLVGAAIVLMLASFNQAGVVGGFLYESLSAVFGIGYFLLPLVAFIIAAVFLLAHEIKFLSPTFIGAIVLILSSLGFIDIVFPGKAGFTGNGLGLIESLFGNIASLVIVGALIIGALVLTLNIPLKIKRKPKKEKLGEEEITIKEPEEGKIVNSDKKEDALETAAEKTLASESEKESLLEKIKRPKLCNYQPPPLSLLKSNIEKPSAGDLRANANIIKRTLDSFNIPVEMSEVNIGPKVTRYSLKPAEGIKLARITALNSDLALALAAHPLRIEAPIPGKSLVGIEVPNKTAAMVRLGSLMSYPEFTKTGPVSFVLGRDVSGNPIAAHIDKMPHLLVCGSTGSGKSILIHSLLISLLYKNSPETLKLVLIDPKRVELSIYNEIPHLIAPVVTEGKKAVNVFRWAIQEMERRYDILLKAGARDIARYNSNAKGEQLPYLLLVVDELADLMSSYGREVETAIVRLAQMARATGIHLVLATQRPSVEVITGLIKANITSRVALQVASQVDSRTILDMGGAEKLLGGGDMLFISSEFSKPKRIQGAFISEDEVGKVTDFIREHNKPNAENDNDTRHLERNEVESKDLINDPLNFNSFSSNEDDDLYDEAVETVRLAKKASASLLQRRLKVGYARAARLLDLMEENGLIGPGEGAKPREVFDVGQSNSELI